MAMTPKRESSQSTSSTPETWRNGVGKALIAHSITKNIRRSQKETGLLFMLIRKKSGIGSDPMRIYPRNQRIMSIKAINPNMKIL